MHLVSDAFVAPPETAMRQSFYALRAVAFALTLGAGCGTTVRPHVRGGTDQPTGTLPGGRLGPRFDPELGVPDETRPVVDQICRAQAMRSGWIATRYLQGAENCPASTDPENPYTAAVIERYSHKPVGATMVVCADQSIPRQWVREHNQDVRASCEGARVRDGASTVMVIRRVSERS